MTDFLQMGEFEQKGYDAWVDLWCRQGWTPTATQCPARWMAEGPQRVAFIRGWTKARNESLKEADHG